MLLNFAPARSAASRELVGGSDPLVVNEIEAGILLGDPERVHDPEPGDDVPTTAVLTTSGPATSAPTTSGATTPTTTADARHESAAPALTP